MNICVPVNEEDGLESEVCAHFGSAPLFLIVDTDTNRIKSIPNRNKNHAHGMCKPLSSIEGENVDAVVVAGIGMGALTKLRNAGIEVYMSQFSTVQDNLDAYKAGALKPVAQNGACGHHHHPMGRGWGVKGPGGSGCSHG